MAAHSQANQPGVDERSEAKAEAQSGPGENYDVSEIEFALHAAPNGLGKIKGEAVGDEKDEVAAQARDKKEPGDHAHNDRSDKVGILFDWSKWPVSVPPK